MCFVIPTAFFIGWTRIGSTTADQYVTDDLRDVMLKMSRGMVLFLSINTAQRILIPLSN